MRGILNHSAHCYTYAPSVVLRSILYEYSRRLVWFAVRQNVQLYSVRSSRCTGARRIAMVTKSGGWRARCHEAVDRNEKCRYTSYILSSPAPTKTTESTGLTLVSFQHPGTGINLLSFYQPIQEHISVDRSRSYTNPDRTSSVLDPQSDNLHVFRTFKIRNTNSITYY